MQGCAAGEIRNPSLARLDIRLKWADAPLRIDFEGASVRLGHRAALSNDPCTIRIESTPDPGVDSWIFTARSLIKKDRVGDTVATWAVLLHVPAGITHQALEGREVDVEVAAEWQQPPIQRRTARIRCEAARSQNFKILNFRMPLEDGVLAEGTLIVRVLP